MKQILIQADGEYLTLEIKERELPMGITHSRQPMSREEIIHYLKVIVRQMEEGIV